jgi:predicted ATPase/DNA-binding CsgD family transcriptional regulator
MVQKPLTSMVGRRQDLSALARVLSDSEIRLVTIVGPGGIGKTRLALEVIDRIEDDFADGTFFIDLVPVRDASFLAERIVSALAVTVSEEQDAREVLFDFLRDRQLLLILDNLEHLLDASPLINELLERSPELVMLVTSRERLGLPAERLFEIRPLSTPDQHGDQSMDAILQSDAVQLFLQRAQAADRDYAISPEIASDIAAICRRLDGLPLAIELAAARVAEIPPHLILRNFVRILPFLERSAHDPEGRHRTMRNTIEWSFDRLSDVEKLLFARLSIFESGFTLDGARAVGELTDSKGDASDLHLLQHLGALVSKHFLYRKEWQGSDPRYDMLEMMREFGREGLAGTGNIGEAREAHANYFLSMAEEFHAQMRTPDPGPWLDRIDVELNEFRAAHDWLISIGQPAAEKVLRLSNRLDYFWNWRGHAPEGIRRIQSALAISGPGDSYERGIAYLKLGNLTENDFVKTRGFYETSLEIMRRLDRKIEVAGILSNLGMTSLYLNNLKEAESQLTEANDLFQELDYTNGVAQCSFHLGSLAARQNEYPLAIEHLDHARELFEQTGDSAAATFTILEMGRIYRISNRHQEANQVLQWGLARFRIANIGQGIRKALAELGWVGIALGSHDEALKAFREVVELSLLSMQQDEHLLFALDGILVLADLASRSEYAAQILAANNRWVRSSGIHRIPDIDAAVADTIERTRERLGNESFRAAWNLGELRTFEESSRFALNCELTAAGRAEKRPPTSSVDYGLTKQEHKILCLLSKGGKNREIAQELFISERTVAVHVQNILRKLDADNRTHASSIAFSAGLCAVLP